MFGRRKPASRATLIETPHLPRVALGPWGSLVYPWWFGTTRLRFKSGRTHLQSWFGGRRDRCKSRLRTFASPSFPFGLDRVLDRCSRRESRVRKRREDHPGPPHDRLERQKARKPGQRQNTSNEEQGQAHGRIQLGAPDDEEEDPQAETDQPDRARTAIRPIQDLLPPALDFGGQVERRWRRWDRWHRSRGLWTARNPYRPRSRS